MLGTILSGRYNIISRLGRGGFSETYLAKDTQLPDHAICVIKQFKPRFDDPQTLKIAYRLFENEAKVLLKLGVHDQIPRLLASFSENGEFYLVQELIEGKSLDYELIAGMEWTEIEVLALVQDILQTLEFVHQQKVIHRDLKPENIIRRESDKKLVLIDFGAVKEVYTQMSNSNTSSRHTITIGTSGYMPSEQSNGRPQPASDIYAVGMLAIQALTGLEVNSIPQDSDTLEINWHGLVQVSRGFEEIIDKMVKYDFRERYLSVAPILDDLGKLLNDSQEPTLISPSLASLNSNTYEPKLHRDKYIAAKTRAKHLSKLEVQAKTPKDLKTITTAFIGIGIVVFTAFGIYRFNQYQNSKLLPINISSAEITKSPDQELISVKLDSQEQTAEELVQEGLELDAFEDAIANFDAAIELEPDYVEAYQAKADVLVAHGKYQEALANYNQAIKLQPDDPELWNAKGHTLTKLTWYVPAIAAYDQAIRLKVDYAEAIGGRAIALEKISKKTPKSPALKIEPKIVSRPQLILPTKDATSGIKAQTVPASLQKTPVLEPDLEPKFPPRPGDKPNLALAAEKLGIEEEQLKEALAGFPPNIAAAANWLKIDESTIRAALIDAGGYLPPKD